MEGIGNTYQMIEIKCNDIQYKLNYYLLFVLIIAPFLVPEYIAISIPILDDILTIISLACMTLYIFINISKIRMSIIILCNAYLLWIFIVTAVLNKEYVLTYCFQIWKAILMCMIINCVLFEGKKVITSFLCAVNDFTMFFFIIDIFYSIFYKTSLGVYCLYGNINSTIKYIMPGIICSLILYKDSKRKNIFFFGYVSGFLFLFFYSYHMITGLMAIIAITGWMIFQKVIRKHIKMFYLFILSIIVLVETTIITASNTGWFIVIASLFNKGSDSLARFYLWRNIIVLIKKNFLFGCGYIDIDSAARRIGNSHGSHNYYLDETLKGGIIGLILLVIIMLLPIFCMKKDRISSSEWDVQYILLGAWISYLIMFLAEPWSGWEVMFLPVICAFFVRQHICMLFESRI